MAEPFREVPKVENVSDYRESIVSLLSLSVGCVLGDLGGLCGMTWKLGGGEIAERRV